MFLHRLRLTHFRNYRHLDLVFEAPWTLLQGNNAQGKTNLLEAIFMLATSKAIHATQEREVVGWQAQEEPIPYCRVSGEVQTDGRLLEVEILLTQREDGVSFTKQIRVNGSPRRAMDVVGLLRAVLFLPEDIKLIDGGPAERRRYLDIALCQLDRRYCQSLAAFQRVLAQRNNLLKQLRDREISPTSPAVDAQLAFWDEKLAEQGARVIAGRHNFLLKLEQIAAERHAMLSGGREHLMLHYVPSFNPGLFSEQEFTLWRDGLLPEAPRVPLAAEQVQSAYLQKLATRRARELVAGATLYGPHRDDLRILANGRDLRLYGSRGQQRSAALSLKLAEVRVMTEVGGSAPLLLLDDVMSELDAERRALLLAVIDDAPQVIVTTTDWEDFTPEFRRRARCFRVCSGIVEAVNLE
ncbi:MULTISPECIES: DNA replication/repair protein RecF [Caldilinea]|jgi:DNA replication and repair protein RecF|uniref:DNA replication and repair protein RecF n=1 Tax=Caldilinea aerophila (strain DSM 14535 / JCM 11387 / NBRC 104270 / STL-6-O1) TaxID=926550 RepID=I0I4I5_CALAS|nr:MULTISPECIES: DNA replication/repair protein RecF [Caldilinea]BAM00173.1 DNA replication and repair protein RecF [Caldilinea aerophila DSM 14535 = NBRC 104270]GIV71532.1 MAG: DNA replication and repair protein RecF [Caldilinea sp.]